MNKDQKEGTEENVKGRAKEAVGAASGDAKKEAEGAAERVAGAVKKAVGDLKHKFSKKPEEEE